MDALRRFALSLPHTRGSEQWGGVAFEVEEKVFCFASFEAAIVDAVVFKCTPKEFDELTEIDGVAQAPYFAKRHWLRVADLLAMPAAELERRIRHSYDLVVANLPKKVQAALAT
ncbi:MAG TPA: MmcQ/YjbR family DNA-binding protein [Opitutaceae bacterium]|nr:MmcQ/YjbR family DNA-binding protein [Opitutaceae bacterium]